MNFGEFIKSRTWRLVQNYIYSWGAAVVLIGALFKLQHMPGAGVFLGVGLSIEALIFFVSAFEPMMEHPDWKRVFPQLRNGEEEAENVEAYKELDKQYEGFGMGGGKGASVSTGISGVELPSDLKDKITKSIENLSKTASSLNDIAAATTATDSFVKNLNGASASIKSVVEANQKASGEMEKSIESISSSYQAAASAIKSSADKALSGISGAVDTLSSNSQKVSEALSAGYKEISTTAGKYSENIEMVNKNLAALNTAYEMQLKSVEKVGEYVGNYSRGVDQIGKLIETSLSETQKFNEKAKVMNDNIQALNNVYGNMLGALNVKK